MGAHRGAGWRACRGSAGVVAACGAISAAPSKTLAHPPMPTIAAVAPRSWLCLQSPALTSAHSTMTPPGQQPRSAATAAVLPPELLALAFGCLDFNEQHMTVALLSAYWHDWALQQRGGNPWFRLKLSQPLPRHAVQHAWSRPGLLAADTQQTTALASAVAGSGDLELLRWLRSQKPPCPWDAQACAAAAGGGHLGVVQWLRAQDPPCPWDERSCAEAARGGHLGILQWLRAQEPPCPWDQWSCAAAAIGGHLGVLQWLRAQDPRCPWDPISCFEAARGGHLGVVQWLRAQERPCPWGERSCAAAARGGHLGVLQWLRAQDPPCPWGELSCSEAARGGHLGVLQWLRAQEPPCPWSWSEVRRRAGSKAVRDWVMDAR